MPLEFRHMRHVIALDEHGSFARAAAALGLSQSALSRSIQSVERQTGNNLFVRTASGVEPTDSGRVFIDRIRQIAQLTDDLDHDLVNERGLQRGHLHVGAGPYPAQSVLADALARFVADYPHIVVRVMMRDWDELLRRLRAREIEFFVAELSTFGSENDLDIEPCAPHPTFILARHGHPLAGSAPMGLADGFAYPNASLTRIPPRILEPSGRRSAGRGMRLQRTGSSPRSSSTRSTPSGRLVLVIQVNADHPGQHPHVDHVGDVVAQLGRSAQSRTSFLTGMA